MRSVEDEIATLLWYETDVWPEEAARLANELSNQFKIQKMPKPEYNRGAQGPEIKPGQIWSSIRKTHEDAPARMYLVRVTHYDDSKVHPRISWERVYPQFGIVNKGSRYQHGFLSDFTLVGEAPSDYQPEPDEVLEPISLEEAT